MTAKIRTTCTILIVEDEPSVRDALVYLLGHLGYQTIAVETVAQALGKLDTATRVILDLNLPDGLGTAVLERIRADNRPIRVAISSGTRDQRLLDEAKKHQPDAILQKPIDVRALLDWLDDAG